MGEFKAGAIIQNSTDEIDIGHEDWKAKRREALDADSKWPLSAAALRHKRGPGPNRRSQSVRYRIGTRGPWRRYGYRTEEVRYDLYKPCPINPNATPTIRDLAKYRWRGEALSQVKEAELIAQAQADDWRAGWELLRSFLRWIRGRPKLKDGNISYGARLFDDCIGAGLLAAWECVRNFDHSKGHRFNTHMRRPVAGAISDAKVAFWMRGTTGATRLQRYVLHHWNHSPERILNDIKKLADFKDRKFINLQEVQDAIEVVEARGKSESYSEDWDNDYGVAHDNEHGPARENYDGVTQSKGVKPLCAGRKQDRIDSLALESDMRAARRLKEIGRRVYALELVAKDHARIATRAEEAQYLNEESRRKHAERNKIIRKVARLNTTDQRRSYDREVQRTASIGATTPHHAEQHLRRAGSGKG